LAQNSRKEMKDFNRTFRRLTRYMVTGGIIYAEVFFSVPRYLANDFKYPDMVKYFEQQIKQMKEKDGLTVKLIADVSRTYGADSANSILDLVLKHKSKDIIGIGMGGDEKLMPAKIFTEVFERARNSGLRTVAHAGESDTFQSVVDSVELLNVERIGHGISAAYDSATMELLKSKNIPLEVAPTSNIVTGHFVKKMEDHPVRVLYDNGVFVTLNSDDPNLFETHLEKEYWNLYDKLGFSLDDIYKIICNGFRAAFMTNTQKQNYIKAVNKQWVHMLDLDKKHGNSWRDSCKTFFGRVEY